MLASSKSPQIPHFSQTVGAEDSKTVIHLEAVFTARTPTEKNKDSYFCPNLEVDSAFLNRSPCPCPHNGSTLKSIFDKMGESAKSKAMDAFHEESDQPQTITFKFQSTALTGIKRMFEFDCSPPVCPALQAQLVQCAQKQLEYLSARAATLPKEDSAPIAMRTRGQLKRKAEAEATHN